MLETVRPPRTFSRLIAKVALEAIASVMAQTMMATKALFHSCCQKCSR